MIELDPVIDVHCRANSDYSTHLRNAIGTESNLALTKMMFWALFVVHSPLASQYQ
jgi:hypothetical protein